MREQYLSQDTFADLRGVDAYLYVGKSTFVLRPYEQNECKCIIAIDSSGFVAVDIRTIQNDGTKHPYFITRRVGSIAQRVITHLAQFRTIQGLEFDWSIPTATIPSNNYLTYVETRNVLIKNGVAVEEAKRTAVQATWTYNRISAPLGYTELQLITEEGAAQRPARVRGYWVKKADKV